MKTISLTVSITKYKVQIMTDIKHSNDHWYYTTLHRDYDYKFHTNFAQA